MDSSLMSIASTGTLTTSNRGQNPAHVRRGFGPPFAVGDRIRCDPGRGCVMMGLVLEAEHPRYRLLLEDGTEVDTGVSPTHLFSREPPGKLLRADDPFRD